MTLFEKLLDELNAVQMASLAGISNTTSVQRWKNGAKPRYDLLKKIAVAKGVTVDELMSEVPKSKKIVK